MMSGYDFLKSQVFSCWRKVRSDCDVVISSGRVFQTRRPATENARQLTVIILGRQAASYKQLSLFSHHIILVNNNINCVWSRRRSFDCDDLGENRQTLHTPQLSRTFCVLNLKKNRSNKWRRVLYAWIVQCLSTNFTNTCAWLAVTSTFVKRFLKYFFEKRHWTSKQSKCFISVSIYFYFSCMWTIYPWLLRESGKVREYNSRYVCPRDADAVAVTLPGHKYKTAQSGRW